MIIQVKSNYKSIKKSEKEFKISDFTILTGKNGSGKTHFLKSIQNGAVKIQDENTSYIDSENILYFDYTNFLVSDNQQVDDKKRQRKLTDYKRHKERLLNNILNKIRNSDIDGWGTGTNMYENNKQMYDQDPAERLRHSYFRYNNPLNNYRNYIFDSPNKLCYNEFLIRKGIEKK